MKLELRTRGVELTEQLRNHVELRLRFALTRFGERLSRVYVLIADVNGPKGGRDIQCKVRAELASHGEVLIREVNEDPFAAVARATDRAAFAVSRQLKRITARRRGRP
jgi:ribosome-associated translation inhibitor RaiA